MRKNYAKLILKGFRNLGIGMLAVCAVTACSDSDVPPPQGAPASTSLVVEQDINWLNDGVRDVGYSIDAIPFTVLSQSVVTIDVLSAGAYAPALDAQIYLAVDDGSIDDTDLISTNDDGEAGADGSTLELDSYLSAELQPGDYVLFISGCCFSAEEALAGYRVVSGDDTLAGLVAGGVNGSYRVTISGQIAR
jgi:hypothetical protein